MGVLVFETAVYRAGGFPCPRWQDDLLHKNWSRGLEAAQIARYMRGSTCADVTELVDVPDLGSGVARRGGSSPLIRTIFTQFSSAEKFDPGDQISRENAQAQAPGFCLRSKIGFECLSASESLEAVARGLGILAECLLPASKWTFSVRVFCSTEHRVFLSFDGCPNRFRKLLRENSEQRAPRISLSRLSLPSIRWFRDSETLVLGIGKQH